MNGIDDSRRSELQAMTSIQKWHWFTDALAARAGMRIPVAYEPQDVAQSDVETENRTYSKSVRASSLRFIADKRRSEDSRVCRRLPRQWRHESKTRDKRTKMETC